MLKSEIRKRTLAVLLDHLDGTLDQDDIEVIAKAVADELGSMREIEDDDDVFQASDLGFYDAEEVNQES